MVHNAQLGFSLNRKPGSGRYRLVTSEWMEDWFIAKHKELKGRWKVREMVAIMKQEWGGLGSVGSVLSLVRKCGLRQVRARLLPILSAATKQRRKEWAKGLTDGKIGGYSIDDTRCVVIHIDEKWFIWHKLKSLIWVGPEEHVPAYFVKSRRFQTKVMVLGAIGTPRPEFGFDGKIGLWGIGHEEKAKRRSKNRERDARVWKAEEMTRQKTIEMIQTLVIPLALQKCGQWAETIVVQMDNAGGHGGGRGDIRETTIAELDAWAAKLPAELVALCKGGKAQKIVFQAQPPHSPDLNALDNGAWWSLQTAVDRLTMGQAHREVSEIEVKDAVLQAWDVWGSAQQISKLFDDVRLNSECIVKCDGGNMYKSPHRKKGRRMKRDCKMMTTGRFPIKKLRRKRKRVV